MSKIEVDQVDPQSGTTLTLGTSGDTVSIPSGVTLANAGTATGFPAPTSGIAASAIDSGTIATARLGSGTASGTTFLAGDQTYKEAGGGLVLQVVSVGYATAVTQTSNAYATSGLTASITPASTSNKVLVLTSSAIQTFGDGSNSSGRNALVGLFRGTVAATKLLEHDSGISMVSGTTSTNDHSYNTVSFSYLDTPSTTSAQVYTVGISGQGASEIRAQGGSQGSTITLIEIKG